MRAIWICAGHVAVLLAFLFSEIECRGSYPSLGHHVIARDTSAVNTHHHRVRRSPSVDDREKCRDPPDNPPATEVDTTARLKAFREKMAELSIDAFIIPMDDAHQSEYVSDHDERVQFISGFSGSAGSAVVLSEDLNKTALWSDGRYHDQGELELDCNWIFMKEGLAGVPTPSEWLASELSEGQTVGADARTLSYDRWIEFKEAFDAVGIIFQALEENPVDDVWDAGGDGFPVRPDFPNNDLIIHEERFAGETWAEKLERVRNSAEGNANVLVFNYMDENAWLFNLRGTDVLYNPVFFSYSIVDDNKATLYLVNYLDKIGPAAIQAHLNVPADGVCINDADCVNVKNYDDFYGDLSAAAAAPDAKVWVSPMSSYAIYDALGDNETERQARAYLMPSTVRQLKGRKNNVEVEHLRTCHKRDSATVIKFIAMLEKQVQAGEVWTEITASDELDQRRRDSDLSRGLSFSTISGFGPNGAIIHYKASNATVKDITTESTYLLDSGGQYDDGTTDVTRTFHFGNPTDFQKEAYTRVLMAVIDLATTIWPNGTYGRDIDVMARGPLWAAGLDYRHGTGHGIGFYLNVHEGPGRINIGYRPTAYESPLYGEMFFSDEPGYYQSTGDDQFGIRLETIVMTTKVETEFQFGDQDYLGFEEFTLVPFEPHLIKYDHLNAKQRKWLNQYHKRCQDEMSPLLTGDQAALDWLSLRTTPIPEDPIWDDDGTDSATQTKPGTIMALLVIFAAKLMS